MPQAIHITPLLDSKFNPAISAAQIISRARLDLPESFLAGQAKVAAISAPAGYGKSTVLASWQQQMLDAGIYVAWLNLDESDNDQARFLRYLDGALRRGLPENSDDVSVDTAHVEPSRASLELLAAQLSRLDYRLCLFLDDIHLIESQAVLDTIHWLAHYAPEQFQLVFAGRNLSHMLLSRLRVRRQLVEFDAVELKFTSDEASAFYASRDISKLSSSDLDLLMDRTEGWPAGLELAGIMLERSSDRQTLLSAFAGDEQNVMDYLGEVMLEDIGPQTRDFLFFIAQFQRISAELAEQATGYENCQQRLDELHRGNFFLNKQDPRGEWFRFHQLIRDFLRQRGLQSHADGCYTALRHGAEFFYQRGLVYEAIQCAMRAQAWETASIWLSDNAEDLVFNRGYLPSIMDWMQQLPQQWADRYPAIRINYAFALTFFCRHRESEEQIQQLIKIRTRLADDASYNQRADELDLAIGALRSYLYALMDKGQAARDEASNWLDKWPDAPSEQRGGITNVLVFANRSCGQLDQAFALSNDMYKWVASKTEGYYVYSWFYVMRSYLFLKRGDYRGAKRTAQEGLETIQRRSGRSDWLNSSYLNAILAMVYYEFNQISEAEECLEKGLATDENYSQADHHIIRYLTQARLLRLRGDSKLGLRVLQQARAMSERLDMPRPALSLIAEEITWRARDGELQQAKELALRYGLDKLPNDGDTSLHADKSYRTAARCLIPKHPEQAAQTLEMGIRYCQKQQLHYRKTEFLVLQAWAWHQAKEVDLAIASLTKALLIAAKQGFYRILLDEGQQLASLLKRVKIDASEAAGQLARQLLDDINGKSKRKAGDGRSSGLIEPLTNRELQILGRLQSDLSNREIAEAIFVSEGTLKWHLHNIYGKLGVRTRSGALAQAKELKLV